MATRKDDLVVTPVFERADQRGSFVEAVNRGPWESLSHGGMGKGAILGQHYHKKTDVFFYLSDGSADVLIEDVRSRVRYGVVLAARQGVIFKPFETHRIRFLEDSRFMMLKSRAFSPDDPDIFSHPLVEGQ